MERDLNFLDELNRYAVFEAPAHALFGRAARLAAGHFRAASILVAVGTKSRLLTRAFDERGRATPAAEVQAMHHVLDRAVGSGSPSAEVVAGYAAVPLLYRGSPFGVLAMSVPEGPSPAAGDLAFIELLGTWLSDMLDLQVELVRRRRRETDLASQKEVLGMIARGAPLAQTMTALATHLERHAPGSLSAIRLVVPDGAMDLVAAPTIPESILLECQAHRPSMPTDSEAADQGARLVIPDASNPEPGSAEFARHISAHDFRAYWAAPILADEEQVGLVELYRSAAGAPSPEEEQLLAIATAIAGIAVERLRAEESLRRSEEYFRSLIENSSELTLVLDRSGAARYASPSAQRALGVSRDGGSVLETMSRKDRDRVADLLARLPEEDRPGSFDFRSAGPGEERHFSAVAADLTDNPAVRGIVVNAQDMTARKAADRALRRSEERYRLVSRSTNDIVWEWDIATGTVVWTEALERVLGYPAGEYGVEWWKERLHPNDRSPVLRSRASALAGTAETWTAEYRFRRAGGGFARILDRAMIARDSHGMPYRMIGSMADETRRHELEEQLRQAHRMEAIGRLAGGVAHDFNNLLTAMTGSVELLRERLPPGNEESHTLLGEIARAGDRAAGLTKQLLAFSRRQVLQPRPLDTAAVARGIEPMLQRLISERITIETELEEDTPCTFADLGQLEQVIMNLAVNARDAMPEGGTLGIRTSRAVVGPAGIPGADVPPGSYACLSVTDTGQGIEADVMSKIFEPFYTTKKTTEGTGLGLSMVYGIVAQSHGHIAVRSTVGEGTRFDIYLPATTARPEQAGSHDGGTEPARGSGTIMVIEDDDAVRGLVQRVLDRAGYTVQALATGSDALALLESGNLRPHTVLTDVVLKGMSGPEIAARIRPLYPDIRIVFMSGYTDEQLGDQGVIGSDVLFLQKPFTPGALLAAMGQSSRTEDRRDSVAEGSTA